MENWKNMSKYTGGKEVNCLKAFMVCDYYPDSRNHIVYYNDLLRALNVKLAICPTPDVVRHVENQKSEGHLPKDLETIWIPHGVDTNIFKKRNIIQKYDVMAVFGLVSYIYPRRPAVQKMIKEMNVSSLVGDWSSGIKHWDYARAINQSKIFVNCNGINNQVLMKYSEAMASGTMLLTNTPNNCNEFGFRPGKHFEVWDGIDELREKILYYLANEDERNEIAEVGMEYTREHFSAKRIASRIKEALELRTQ
jgi:glycosyltransferase involved in cell wall biosynthesis